MSLKKILSKIGIFIICLATFVFVNGLRRDAQIGINENKVLLKNYNNNLSIITSIKSKSQLDLMIDQGFYQVYRDDPRDITVVFDKKIFWFCGFIKLVKTELYIHFGNNDSITFTTQDKTIYRNELYDPGNRPGLLKSAIHLIRLGLFLKGTIHINPSDDRS